MRASLKDLLKSGQILLADGATATNYFGMGLESGEPPEFWNTDHPDRVVSLHQQFVDAGSDIILTNTFGCNRHRLKLHKAESRVHELAKHAAELARQVADKADRPVVVAGSVGPTGELFEPLGALTEAEAIDTFAEQIAGLRDGGADVVWIETMSAPEEIRAAAQAAINVGVPYVGTMSFDTAGRTMMGLKPDLLESVFEGLSVPPLAIGANCGVGASDVLVSVSEMKNFHNLIVSKGNCGIPKFHGTTISYSGTPELMRNYAMLAADAGARIVGGCCGTTPSHVAAMRDGLDHRTPGPAPTLEDVIVKIGPLVNSVPSDKSSGRKSRRDNN
ncbi:MAG: betaine--homocysteine S-methyltransferase [Ilumatobacteraceae bacterium]